MRKLPVVVLLAIAAYLLWWALGDREQGSLDEHEDIVIYTSNSCGKPCKDMIEAIQAAGVHAYVSNLDDDHELEDELRAKLTAIGFDRKVYRLPVVDVYGTLLPDNPPVRRVMKVISADR